MLVRIPAPGGGKTPSAAGWTVHAGIDTGMADPRFWRLPGGFAGWLSYGASDGMCGLGSVCRAAAETGIFLVLETAGHCLGAFSLAGEKIFAFCENFVCIC